MSFLEFLRLLELKQKVRAHVAGVNMVPRHFPSCFKGPLLVFSQTQEAQAASTCPRSHHHFQNADAEPRTFIIQGSGGRGHSWPDHNPGVAKAWNWGQEGFSWNTVFSFSASHLSHLEDELMVPVSQGGGIR